MTKQRCRLILSAICFLSMAVSSATAQQQSKTEIRGTLIEKDSREALQGATIRLLAAKDSTLKSGTSSSAKGYFSMKNISPGAYILHVSYIGFEPVYKSLKVNGSSQTLNLGSIEVSENSVMLDEAVVTAKAIEVIVRDDTVEYNADSYKVTEGSMLEDLLKKMPGVEVDSDGNISVNGKQIQKVLVDGKEFFSDDPKVAAKNLPAKMVEKVQTYEKKSDMTMMTGFDDDNEEAVINLTVKKGMKQGLFGNAFAGYGSKERYEGNFMVNSFTNNDQYSLIGGINNTNNMGFSDLASTMFSGMSGGGRRGMGSSGPGNGITQSGNIGTNFSKEFSPKFTMGGSVSFSHSDNDAESKTETENINNENNFYDYETVRSTTINNNLSTNLRMTWNPDTLTQVIITPRFSYSNTEQNESSDSHTLDHQLDSINSVTSDAHSEGNGYNLSGSIEASRKLNNKGRVLSISLSGESGDKESDSYNYSLTDYLRSEELNSDIIDQQVFYDNKNHGFRGSVSWVEPIGKNNFIQLYYRYSNSKNEALKNAYTPDNEGDYNILDSVYSQSSRNEYVNQRASLSFKAQRELYNYTLGLNFDPSSSKTETFVGEDVLYSSQRHVVNFSPTLRFNYRPSREKNFRFRYDGRTSQPTMQQLQPVEDVSNPLNTTIGNPDLKPYYTNTFRIRYYSFNREKSSAFILYGRANYTINDIVSSVFNDANTGRKHTTYRNTNGNYSAYLRNIINTPLRNKKFSINNMAYASFTNSNSYIDDEQNTNKTLQLQNRLSLDFRSDLADFGLKGNISHKRIRNSMEGQTGLNTYDYGGGFNTTLYLPYEFKIESDITYSTNAGYSDGYELNEWLWNASVSKSFMKGNAATLRLKMYDILQERSNISYTASSTYTRYSEYNTLNSYFMLHFIYRFNIFKGGASMSDMKAPDGRGSRRGGPPR